MNPAGWNGQRFQIRLEPGEREALLALLALYPLVPEDHHATSRRGGPDDGETAALLREALAAERAGARRRLAALLDPPWRFAREGKREFFRVASDEIEWMLQIFNDLRVGAWLKLGSPGSEAMDRLRGKGESARWTAILEICGFLEMVLIRAAAGENP